MYQEISEGGDIKAHFRKNWQQYLAEKYNKMANNGIKPRFVKIGNQILPKNTTKWKIIMFILHIIWEERVEMGSDKIHEYLIHVEKNGDL